MDSHARRVAVAPSLAAVQKGIGTATVARNALLAMWERLPPEYAAEVQRCLDRNAECARLLGLVAMCLRDIPLARADGAAVPVPTGRDAA